jgi:hypothetical protein
MPQGEYLRQGTSTGAPNPWKHRRRASALGRAWLAISWLPGCTTPADIAGMRPQSISDKTTGQRITALQTRYSPDTVANCKTLSGEARTACRDDIVLAELTASDLAFEDFEWAAWASNAGFSTLSDFAVTRADCGRWAVSNRSRTSLIGDRSGRYRRKDIRGKELPVRKDG